MTTIKDTIGERDSLFARFFSLSEFNALSKIAWPLILSSLVTMSVSITDVIMIGQLGTKTTDQLFAYRTTAPHDPSPG